MSQSCQSRQKEEYFSGIYYIMEWKWSVSAGFIPECETPNYLIMSIQMGGVYLDCNVIKNDLKEKF